MTARWALAARAGTVPAWRVDAQQVASLCIVGSWIWRCEWRWAALAGLARAAQRCTPVRLAAPRRASASTESRGQRRVRGL